MKPSFELYMLKFLLALERTCVWLESEVVFAESFVLFFQKITNKFEKLENIAKKSFNRFPNHMLVILISSVCLSFVCFLNYLLI